MGSTDTLTAEVTLGELAVCSTLRLRNKTYVGVSGPTAVVPFVSPRVLGLKTPVGRHKEVEVKQVKGRGHSDLGDYKHNLSSGCCNGSLILNWERRMTSGGSVGVR